MQEKQLYFNELKRLGNGNESRPGMAMRIDAVIISAVILLLLLAAAFSLGVEKGKHLSTAKQATTASGDIVVAKLISALPLEEELMEATPEISEPEVTITIPKPAITPAIRQIEKTPSQEIYRVQIASLKKKATAQEEALKLQDKGWPAYYYKSGNYNVVYVEGGREKEQAQKILTQLKQQYKDSFLIRRL